VSHGNHDDVSILAEELAINGPIHISQIPEQTCPRTRLGRAAMDQVIENGWGHRIAIRGCTEFIAASLNNPFIGQTSAL
jgi:hypothetical protein